MGIADRYFETKRHHKYRHLVAVTLWEDSTGNLCGDLGHDYCLADRHRIDTPIYLQFHSEREAFLADCYRLGDASMCDLINGWPVRTYVHDERLLCVLNDLDPEGWNNVCL